MCISHVMNKYRCIKRIYHAKMYSINHFSLDVVLCGAGSNRIGPHLRLFNTRTQDICWCQRLPRVTATEQTRSEAMIR